MISVNVFWIFNIRIVSRKADECVFVSVHLCGAVWHGGNYIQMLAFEPLFNYCHQVSSLHSV